MQEFDDQWIRGAQLGSGSFGTVSLAYRKSTSQLFAVKSASATRNPQSVPSLENEIRILRSLDSEYIVSYLGHSTTDQHRNLHMEYMPGGTIADVAGKIGEHLIREYTRCIVRALVYLHCTAGVVHSDVKGRNVLLGNTPGSAKLADFGSARRVSEQGAIVGGTPLWMAPEVIRGELTGVESDIWSLGCTVIEMVTGGSPWGKGLGEERLLKIGYGEELPELPSGLSKDGRSFVDKCLRRDGSERWTAERLLEHPFLKDVDECNVGCSPRSVFDWLNLGFDEEDGEREVREGSWDDLEVELGRRRLTELVRADNNDGLRNLDWEDSEGWEMVR